MKQNRIVAKKMKVGVVTVALLQLSESQQQYSPVLFGS